MSTAIKIEQMQSLLTAVTEKTNDKYLNLKEGENEFIKQARLIKKYGAAVIGLINEELHRLREEEKNNG